MVVLGSFRIIELISTKIVLLSFFTPNGQCDCLYRPEWQNLLDDFLKYSNAQKNCVKTCRNLDGQAGNFVWTEVWACKAYQERVES